MEIKQLSKGEKRIIRKFDPSRLANEILAQAYEIIVPQKVRVYPSSNNNFDPHAEVFEKNERRVK